jgi:hypothetical protein
MMKVLIQNCNKVILLLDNLEESRPLFKSEFNFRKLVKLHHEKLLHAECQYWRKRCTARWIRLAEDNTIFFHARAIERNRRNNIASLRAEDGRLVFDHHEMAGLLWICYKQRMGSTVGIQMKFQPDRLIKRVDGLDQLPRPFEKEEMDLIIKSMP